jgi:hypothetical protein
MQFEDVIVVRLVYSRLRVSATNEKHRRLAALAKSGSEKPQG